jgi:hypothetical protein
MAAWLYQRGCRSFAAKLTAVHRLPVNLVLRNEEKMNEDLEIPDDLEEVTDQLL